MTLETYNNNIINQSELEIRTESLIESLQFYVLFSKIEQLSFYEYDYELNTYKYSFSVDHKSKYIVPLDDNFLDSEFSFIIEKNNTIYGMIVSDKMPQSDRILNEILEKVKDTLEKKSTLLKQFLLSESPLDVFIITDENSIEFAKKLQTSLDILMNVNIKIETTVSSIVDSLKEKTKKSILIYTVDNDSLLKTDSETLNLLNEFLFVIGPNDFNISLYCGHLNVYKYLSKEEFIPEGLKKDIIDTKGKIQNKYINKNKIIAISGISGGIGVTTIAMNVANMIAKANSDKNVLYIELSKTKAISNLFLSGNPLPKKTIIDLVNSGEKSIEKSLENGLEKIRENFYSINGIQKHIDSDYLEQDVFIEKFLEYISKVSDDFNYIIIDTGEADAGVLNSTMYDIVNELWILTEMSLPQISKLKTFFSLMKRAGLKDKLTFLVNRYDSVNAISVSDVTSILNTANEDHLNFDYKIPNDYKTLGHCWSYCELVSLTNNDSIFVKKLEKILSDKNFLNSSSLTKKSRSWLPF
jgi:cellulose biosynthesis protein BcsQ